jgi:hypothetical protein
VPVAPPPVRNSGSSSTSTPATSSTGGTKPLGAPKSGSASSSSSSSKSSDPYAQSRADQRKRDMATRDRYIGDAEQMQGQIRALRHTLGKKGDFKDALKKRLRNINTVLDDQLADLDKAAAARAGSLDLDAKNNEIAAGDATTETDANRIRERTMALSEVAAQGGGESDALRAQLMSLRSGAANQNEVNRSFADSERSINSSRLDLALDTHNARVNMMTEANADKEQLWGDFYAQTSEAQTQLGNALGQQAEYYGLALEAQQNAGGGGKGKGKGGKGKDGGKPVRGGKGGGELNIGGPDGGRPHGGGRPGGGLTGPTLGRVRAGSGEIEPTGLGGPRGNKGPRYGLGEGNEGPRLGNVLNGGRGGGKSGAGRRRFGKGLAGDEARASAQSDRAFLAAAKSQGRVWKNPGLSKEMENWQPPEFETKVQTNSLLQSVRTVQAPTAPEGATLRKW